MKNKEKSENRKALPKYLGILLLSALIGGVLGVVMGVAGATSLPEKITAGIYTFLQTVTPWSILVLTLLLLGPALMQYRSAKKQFAAWDGEDEETMDKAEEKLTWSLLLAGLNMIANLFFFGIGVAAMDLQSRLQYGVLFLSFLLSFAAIVIMQQKVVDLVRKMNPEKKGSVYDTKFQKKWLESCDENEQRQIGQASGKAFRAVNNTCMFLWLALVVLGIIFDIGVLPFFLVTLIFAVSETVYTAECIRLGRHKK